MNQETKRMAAETMPQETAALLQRIVKAVEQKERKRWLELTSAVLLSLAAVASAWCAYQASRWSGVQTFRLAAANKADRAAMEHQIAALQFRSFDASLLVAYTQARFSKDNALADFLYQHIRPQIKPAVDAWLKTDPFNNPAAPLSPFHLPEYVQPDEQAAKAQSAVAVEQHAAAQRANHTSDTYVLLTVLFAIVLFFGGISGTLRSHRLQAAAASVALVLFVATVVLLVTMPICHE